MNTYSAVVMNVNDAIWPQFTKVRWRQMTSDDLNDAIDSHHRRTEIPKIWFTVWKKTQLFTKNINDNIIVHCVISLRRLNTCF